MMLYPYGHFVVAQLKANPKKDAVFDASDASPLERKILAEMVSEKVIAKLDDAHYVLVRND